MYMWLSSLYSLFFSRVLMDWKLIKTLELLEDWKVHHLSQVSVELALPLYPSANQLFHYL